MTTESKIKSGDLCPACAAVRVPVAEPAPREPSAAALPCQGCGEAIPDGAPFHERVADGCPFCSGCAAENAAGEDPDEMRRGTWPDAEPPAPTADASAELATARATIIGGAPRGSVRRLTKDALAVFDAERDALRARVAELEAAHARAAVFERRTSEALLAKVATLAATPPPGTVAALLARVEEERKTALDARDEYLVGSTYSRYDGEADAYQEAARLITATLGAPTDLDRAVGEVVALPPYTGTLADAFDRIGEALDLVGDESTPEGTRRALAKVARVALAGMLACDAPPSAPTAGEVCALCAAGHPLPKRPRPSLTDGACPTCHGPGDAPPSDATKEPG